MIFLLIGNSCTLSALSPRHLLQIKFQKMILFYYEGNFKGIFDIFNLLVNIIQQ